MYRNLLYQTGGVLLVVGAALPLFAPAAAPWVFAAGALLFSYFQFSAGADGESLTIRRLHRQQMFGALLLLATAALMFTARYGIAPFRGHEWMLTLCIAAVWEAYTIFRLDYEEKKAGKRA